MEDAHLLEAPWVDDNTAIFGVFDGHFGTKCSEYVARSLPEVLRAHPKFNEDVHLALTESFLHVDKEFLKQASAEKLGDGSTGVVTLIKNEKIYCANTGDSRAVLCEGGKTVALSEDHKPEVPKELARIEQAGGIILLGRVQGKLAVARSFGDLDFKNEQTLEARWITAEPDILEVPLTTDTEFILLACDGLWDKFSNEEAVEFVRKRIQTNVPTLDIAKEIVQEAYNLGSTDNITAVLIVFNHSIKNKSVRRAGTVSEAHGHAPQGHAEHNTNVSHTPSKKKDKTPKKEPKGVTKTTAEPPQVIPPKKGGHSAKTTGDKPRTPRGDATEASKPHNDEPSQSNTSDEKKTELASPKSDKSLSKESTGNDKSPRKHKEDKDKKKHKRDESKASSSNSSPAMNVKRGGADVAVNAEDVKRSNSASDSIGNDKS
eukprot:TRINITY_DN3963_c0_g1_i2.p1 TRINITY_DN3963_c0_g1~~TRINITY_DN3963_c0_g1_i2.p1  ORF type:complete len:478 (-),score=110.62 TRINITY_DN3963_c0_g1_i2:105-1397(-)